MKTVLRIAVFVLLALLVLLSVASAQMISPLRSEFGKKVRNGEVHVQNVGIKPIQVTLEPRSIQYGPNGRMTFVSLDPSVRLRLSATSATLAPKQGYVFYYNADPEKLPTSFALFASFYDGHPNGGLGVAIHLESVVYVCQKQKHCRETVLQSHGISAK